MKWQIEEEMTYCIINTKLQDIKCLIYVLMS